MRECVLDIETTSLDPKEGRIVCIGVKNVKYSKYKIFMDTNNEEIMIKEFLDYYRYNKFDTVIGYNVVNFDMRYIFIKCLKYELDARELIFSKHIDLMYLLRSFKNGFYGNGKFEKLDVWASYLLNQGKIPIPRSVKELYKRGEYSTIITYNKQDLRITHNLYKRLKKVFGWEE